jgi:hypothetical protein
MAVFRGENNFLTPKEFWAATQKPVNTWRKAMRTHFKLVKKPKRKLSHNNLSLMQYFDTNTPRRRYKRT